MLGLWFHSRGMSVCMVADEGRRLLAELATIYSMTLGVVSCCLNLSV